MDNLKNRLLLTVLLLALVIFHTPHKASGASIDVQLGEHSVDVRVESRLFQNMTELPETRVEVTGPDLSEAQAAFQEALRTKKQDLSISSFSIDISSNQMWLNVTAKFTLDDALDSSQDTLKADLRWLPFKVSSDLKAGSLSYNLVGSKQLRPYVERLPNQTGIKYFSPTFTPITAQMAANTAGNATIFDLQAIRENVSYWPRSFDLNTQTTVWNRMENKNLDLRILIETVNVSKTFYSYMNTSARVSVRGHALAFGDTVVVERTSGRQELMMIGAFAGFVALSAVAHFYGRKILARSRKGAIR